MCERFGYFFQKFIHRKCRDYFICNIKIHISLSNVLNTLCSIGIKSKLTSGIFSGSLSKKYKQVFSIGWYFSSTLKNKILADVKIYPIRFFHTSKIKYVINDYDDIVKRYRWECGILEDIEEVTLTICNIAKQLSGNTLILFDHIEHGNKLFKLLDHDNKCFVDGSVDLDDREKTRLKMSIKNSCITIANAKCFGTGITIKQIQNVVFAMNGKGVTKIIQAVGRSLERNKQHANLIDIFHNYKYSTRHFEERVKLYKKFYNIDIVGNDIKTLKI